MPHYDEARGLLNNTIAQDATLVATATHAAASKATPVDTDELPLVDSASSFSLKKLTWANLKATLAAWLNSALIPISVTVAKSANGITVSLTVASAAKMHLGSGTDNSPAIKTTELLFSADDAAWTGSGASIGEERTWLSVSDLVVRTSNGGARAERARFTGGGMTVQGQVTSSGGATLQATSAALTNGAGASVGTLANAPAAGNPTKWVGINDNGTIRYIPTW